MQETLQWVETFFQSELLRQIVSAFILILVTALVAWLAAHFLRKWLSRDNTALPSSSIFINIIRATIWIIGTCIILSACFGVNISALIAALGVGGIALSLGFQDTISNLIGGLQVSLMKIIQPGDFIEVGKDSGEVKDVNWRHTTIVNNQGQMVIVPNSIINKTALTTFEPSNQISLPLVVHPGTVDLNLCAADIEQVCKKAVESKVRVIEQPRVRFTEVTDQGVKGTITFRVAKSTSLDDIADVAVRSFAPLVHQETYSKG